MNYRFFTMKQIDLNNKFYLSLNYGISILETYDYKMSYMENVARNFTKKYPSCACLVGSEMCIRDSQLPSP